jgi:hypothetical protein
MSIADSSRMGSRTSTLVLLLVSGVAHAAPTELVRAVDGAGRRSAAVIKGVIRQLAPEAFRRSPHVQTEMGELAVLASKGVRRRYGLFRYSGLAINQRGELFHLAQGYGGLVVDAQGNWPVSTMVADQTAPYSAPVTAFIAGLERRATGRSGLAAKQVRGALQRADKARQDRDHYDGVESTLSWLANRRPTGLTLGAFRSLARRRFVAVADVDTRRLPDHRPPETNAGRLVLWRTGKFAVQFLDRNGRVIGAESIGSMKAWELSGFSSIDELHRATNSALGI